MTIKIKDIKEFDDNVKNKQFHLKIKWKNREKTEAYEIVLYDGGQPLCELISVDDARLVQDIMNEQEETIQNQKEYILLLEQKLEEYGIRLEPKDFDEYYEEKHRKEKIMNIIWKTIMENVRTIEYEVDGIGCKEHRAHPAEAVYNKLKEKDMIK